ncbi:transcription factor IBH1-like 1 isoform X2 [Typha latifolia]|uniref:transcription factor IBH1-like 1 isoform X2 n=1 Tax=Typha latifolia TaxID=4733 RepID=UPI003C2CB496
MQDPNSFKQAFVKYMLMGLQASRVSSKSMSLQERKEAIKSSADIAMAFARGGANWTNALITSLSKKEQSHALLRSITGKQYERLTKSCYLSCNVQRSKKILRRSYRICSSRRSKARHVPPRRLEANVLARSMAKKRTRVLKKMIPGGEFLDGLSLLNEAFDYVSHLRAQVDLLQCLSRATEVSKLRACSECTLKEMEAPNVNN